MSHPRSRPRLRGKHDFLNGIVHQFLDSNFSIILIIVSLLIGLAALFVTPREEDPQIVVPLADVYRQLSRPFGRPRSSNWSPRRWRRSSTRSTAWNTSTPWPARTRRSSRSGTTSARTASGAWSSSTRSSTRTRTSSRRA